MASYTFVILLIVSFFGIMSMNYTGVIAILVGIAVYFTLINLISYFRKHIRLFIIFLLDIILITVYTIINPTSDATCPITDYLFNVIPETPQLDKLKIQEFVVQTPFETLFPQSTWIKEEFDNQTVYRLPDTYATIIYRGLLKREAVINRSVNDSCTKISEVAIQLYNFPINSFSEAYLANDLIKYPYIDTETVVWKTNNLNIRFSYIPPPFHTVYTFIIKLLNLSSSSWFLGLIGLIIGSLLPVWAQNTLGDKSDNKGKSAKKFAKIIISMRGEEKDVEIKNTKR